MSLEFAHELALCAIIKDEGDYMAEWLDYHRAIGFTKFYIYDNESSDDTRTVLAPYMDSGLVSYESFPGKLMQMAAYNDAVRRHRYDCRYLAFIDADEFIFPADGRDLGQTLAEIFGRDKAIGGVTMNWRWFGTGGEEKKDLSRGVIERFCYRPPDDYWANYTVKSIVDPRAVQMIINPHYAVYCVNRYAVDENGEMVESYENKRNPAARLAVCHYYTKSVEEFLQKKRRGRADSPKSIPAGLFAVVDKDNIFDDSLLRFSQGLTVPPLTPFDEKAYLETAARKLYDDMVTTEKGDEDVSFLLASWHRVHRQYRRYLSIREAAVLEELLLERLHEAFFSGHIAVGDFQLLLDELPDIILRPYEAAKKFRAIAIEGIEKLLPHYRCYRWEEHEHLAYILRLLKNTKEGLYGGENSAVH